MQCLAHNHAMILAKLHVMMDALLRVLEHVMIHVKMDALIRVDLHAETHAQIQILLKEV